MSGELADIAAIAKSASSIAETIDTLRRGRGKRRVKVAPEDLAQLRQAVLDIEKELVRHEELFLRIVDVCENTLGIIRDLSKVADRSDRVANVLMEVAEPSMDKQAWARLQVLAQYYDYPAHEAPRDE